MRDLAAHIVGDDLNRLSRSRDHHVGDGPAATESLAEFVHRINDEWVRALARVSPAAIVTLLEATTPRVLSFWRSRDLDALGEPVSWAGQCDRPEGTVIRVHVEGSGGGQWAWRCHDGRWSPIGPGPERGTVMGFPEADSLWRLCTRMPSPTVAERRVVVAGDRELTQQVLQIVSIIR